MEISMEKILNKIKNLLDLANNNPNENEAIAAALKAQELMAKYNIELDQLDEKKETREIVKEVYYQSSRHEMKKMEDRSCSYHRSEFQMQNIFPWRKRRGFLWLQRGC